MVTKTSWKHFHVVSFIHYLGLEEKSTPEIITHIINNGTSVTALTFYSV